MQNHDETVDINGSCTKANTVEVKESIYFISEEAIQSLFMFSSASSTYLQAKIIDRTKNGFTLVFHELSWDYGYLKIRSYEYEK